MRQTKKGNDALTASNLLGQNARHTSPHFKCKANNVNSSRPAGPVASCEKCSLFEVNIFCHFILCVLFTKTLLSFHPVSEREKVILLTKLISVPSVITNESSCQSGENEIQKSKMLSSSTVSPERHLFRERM